MQAHSRNFVGHRALGSSLFALPETLGFSKSCTEGRSCHLAIKVHTVKRKSGAMAASFHAESSRDDAGSRKGNGVAMVWLRNDLRVLDNEALLKAWQSSHAVLPLYCVDPRTYEKTHTFGFPKTGELRAQFIMESVADLRKNLQQRGLDLIVRRGKPEDVVPSIAKAIGAHTVFAHKETCSEETAVERGVQQGLHKLGEAQQKRVVLQFVWGGTLYHLDDLPFMPAELPDIYTQFRKGVEFSCKVRPALKMPTQMGPLPENVADKIGAPGDVPIVSELGLKYREQSPLGVLHFEGGETAAIARLQDYFWQKDRLRVYKETRNGMLGADYSTKFSPWLAHGCITPRTIHDEVKRYEQERVANDSTYWVLFELIWRDYFRFISVKYGNTIFHVGGPRSVVGKLWSQNKERFEAWQEGQTGYPLIDANMKELAATGFMSNRGRQIVCSFLVRDLGLDWRMGAEWFETCLLDYDPCSNYGNWTYGAGVGNDPREDRYFSIPKQASTYDPEGKYVAHWIPSLSSLPARQRNFPPDGAYLRPIVPLKFGMSSVSNPNKTRSGNDRKGGRGSSSSGQSSSRGRGTAAKF
ncbi:hypothetical protein BDL97_16G079800 [Sphagnum fallax]|nr:hypothetical protein BDL97_16G079800 [Sphagnum fallax]KAH8938391.1 hypothetical protein BDL97_16G079800 [Sphagnum fallax]